MRKSITFIFVLLALLASRLPMSAQYVTTDAAREKANAFLTRSVNSESSARRAPRKAPVLSLATSGDEYYAFNDDANGGYVVISGEERMPDVLAYSYDGHFDADNMPCNMRAWMEGYARQVEYLRAHPEVKAARKTASERKNISPMLTCWFAQGYPYNNKCPEVDGEHCLTGCVATAMAQIMHYWQWPKQTTAAIPAYTTSTLNIEVPAIPVTTIDWENILEKYTFTWNPYIKDGELVVETVNEFNEEQADAISTLMQLCGSAVEMDYDKGLSTSSSSLAAQAYCQYFDYNMPELIFPLGLDTDEWEEIIYDELIKARPIYFSGYPTISNIGHAFVLDGYENGYFHANWGWGGTESYVSMYSTEGWYDYDPFSSSGVIGIQPAYPDSPVRYAVFDKGIMTLYYDKEKDTRSGIILSDMKELANYKEEVTECVIDPSFADYRPRNLSEFFAGWKNMKFIKGLEYLNTEKVTSMNQMFYGCSNLTSLDVSGFKTDRVKEMWCMFGFCSNLTSLDVSGFNTNRVVYLSDMFYGCSNLTSLDLSGFNTKNAEYLNYMFCGCSNLATIYASDLWDMSNVTSSNGMFYDCPKLVGGAGTTFDWNNVSGEYARIDGGTSSPGYFTYKESSDILIPLPIGEKPSDVYNLGGAKVRSAKQGTDGLPSGLYIINKKKVIVK